MNVELTIIQKFMFLKLLIFFLIAWGSIPRSSAAIKNVKKDRKRI